jgi:hypothetical protein
MPKLIAGKTLISFNDGQPDVVVPGYVEAIAENAFYDSGYIITMTVPDSVRSIGSGAFRMCYCMKSVRLPAVVDSFGTDVFRQCRALTCVVLPEGVKKIDAGMFAGCGSLEELSIPDSTCEIDPRAFTDCEKLMRIRIRPSRVSMLPEAFRDTAVLSFMHDAATSDTADDEESASADEYVRSHPSSMMELAIRQDDVPAADRMMRRGLACSDADLVRLSSELGRTEITALLLADTAREGGKDDVSWDPFA